MPTGVRFALVSVKSKCLADCTPTLRAAVNTVRVVTAARLPDSAPRRLAGLVPGPGIPARPGRYLAAKPTALSKTGWEKNNVRISEVLRNYGVDTDWYCGCARFTSLRGRWLFDLWDSEVGRAGSGTQGGGGISSYSREG